MKRIEGNFKEKVIFEGQEFRNVYNTTNSALFECMSIIDGFKDDRVKEIKFDKDRTMYDLKLGFFLIIYEDEKIRNGDLELFNKINIENTLKIHNPEIRAEFEYKGKPCLIISAEKRLEGETNNFLYKGMIVNPGLYLENHGIDIIGVKN